MGDSVNVKVVGAKDLKGSADHVFCRVKLGNVHRETRIAKRSSNYSWNELFPLKADGSEKTLLVEVWKHSMLKKTLLGTVTIDIHAVKEGEQWYKIIKKKDPNPTDRGELQLSVDVNFSGGKSPRGKKGPTLKELEVSVPDEFVMVPVAKPAALPDPATRMRELSDEETHVTAGADDLGKLKLQGVSLELGTVKIVWSTEAHGGVKLELWIPRKYSWNQTYFQGPYTRLNLEYPKLKFRPAHRLKISLEEDKEDSNLAVGLITAKAISLENKRVDPINAAFKINKEAISKVVQADDHFESLPDQVDGELSAACFKGLVEKVEECLNRWDDVNQQNEEGDTPLHKAVTNGSEAIVQLLVERGGEPRLNNKYGQSPVDVCEKFFKQNLVPLLRTYQ